MLMLSSHCEGQASATTAIKPPMVEKMRTSHGCGHQSPAGIFTAAQGPVQAMMPAKKAARNPAKLPSTVLAPRSSGSRLLSSSHDEKTSFHEWRPIRKPNSEATG